MTQIPECVTKMPPCVEPFMNKPEFVFKKCTDEDRTFLVVLAKLFDCKNNESRKGVQNANFAKFRCNGLVPVVIFDLRMGRQVSEVSHWTVICGTRTLYKIGQLVEPATKYWDGLDICAPGIHYFLTAEAALGYDLRLFSCSLNGVSYNENGGICCLE